MRSAEERRIHEEDRERDLLRRKDACSIARLSVYYPSASIPDYF